RTMVSDQIALGYVRYPFSYNNGTSMAAPAATGVLSVIAGKHADSLGTAGTPAFAEKLAALVKGSAATSAEFEPYCATGGMVSIDGANNPGPAISSITAGEDTFTLTGYFMDHAAVTVDGVSCSYTQDIKDNDKYVLTVQKPAGYKGGTPVVGVYGTNGKMDRSVLTLSEASGKETPGLYDHANIPLPAETTHWNNYDLTGCNGRIYLLPRSDGDGVTLDSFFAYDPEHGSWEKIQLPLESLTLSDTQLLSNIFDMTACVKDGKLLMLLTGKNASQSSRSVLVTMDSEGNFEVLGSQEAYTRLPALGTLVSDGSSLYLVGGILSENGTQTVFRGITQLMIKDTKEIGGQVIGLMTESRFMPRVSYGNGKMIICSGYGGAATGAPSNMPAFGADQYILGQTESQKIEGIFSLTGYLPYMTFSSGALNDGTFMIAGPAGMDGETDTYVLSQDLSVKAYEKRAWSSNLLTPASVAYNGGFYVLADIAPSGIEEPSLVFSFTAVNADVPEGDALIRTIKSAPAKTGDGVPEFKNTDITVTQKDLVNNLKDKAQRVIDRINNASKDSEVYLEVNKLEEKAVAEAKRQAVKAAADKEKMSENLFWMDLSMYLQIPEQERIKLDENLAGTKVSIKVPDFPAVEKGYTRSYKIFACNPDGEEGKKAEVIAPEFNAQNQTLSFSMKKSSVYAIGYLDETDP
ncbi:MAG: hypothetical protein HUJ54_13120, partial [Erysipelotrichaceae bacterium]|nr:hypothetical protein [Erysipelotrichaceae bacterium]